MHKRPSAGGERIGIIAAIFSSTLGGLAAATTRFAVSGIDPVTLSMFRFGGGFVLLLPIALMLRSRWPQGRDWIGTALLGVMLYAGFFVVYSVAFIHTTAARGALAISTLPLLTMVVAALLGAEPLTRRKAAGVLIAFAGVAIALLAGLTTSPQGAWRGDLLMLGGVVSMAFFNVWSRPLIGRSSALGFVTLGMGFGAACLVGIVLATGRLGIVPAFDASQWVAVVFLSIFGGAGAFFLWIFALQHTTPTRVANTGTITPLASALLAAVIVNEPIGFNLVVGLAAVAVGIWLASTEARKS